MTRRRTAVARAAAALAAGVVLAGCRDHTVAVRFEPEVGDTYRLRSDVEARLTRTVADVTEVERTTSRLDATETVVAIGAEAIDVAVTVERDGGAPRSYDVSFDPSGRLSTIDLVEGVPTDALGLDLATDLPTDISAPPDGPLEPRTTWTIERVVGDGDDGVVVTGSGRIDRLGVEDGADVVVAVVELRIPLRSVVDTADGRVTVRGEQTVRSRTTYDLGDGIARADRTDIRGAVDVVVEPPSGIVAPPVPGSIEFVIETRTRRVGDD